MATFDVEYICTNCEKTEKASNTYANDSATKSIYAAKAVDGCYFVENDSANCYMETMGTNGALRKYGIGLQKVSSLYDSEVINGEKVGITSDGKYICGIFTSGSSNTGTRKVYFKASGGTPSQSSFEINNTISGTVAKVTENGKSKTITLTGAEGGKFEGIPEIYGFTNDNGDYISQGRYSTKMTVNGNVATGTINTYDDSCTVGGATFNANPVKELQITNNITNTTAKAAASETNYIVTVTGNAQGMFNGTPTITYGGETYGMTVNNQTASIIVPITTESVIINGEYLLGDYIVVDYRLTNCEIVGNKPVKVKTGERYTFNFKANPNAELTEIQANFIDNYGDRAVSNGTISEDKQTGTVTFKLTTGATDLTVYANADAVQPPTIKNYGAINVYIVTLENLDDFAKKRFFKPTGESDTGTTYTEVNLGEYVNRIKRIFAPVPVGGDDVLKCGNYNTEIKVQYPESDIMLLDFGNVELTGANGNNEDYNAQIQMFIPCRGVVSIDSNYIDKTINLSIKVNVITGDAVALLSCDSVTFQIESFSLSRDVIYRLGTDLNVVGGEQWNEQILYGLEPYVLITENLTVNVPVNGTQENVTVKNVTGFAQFENVNLNDANLLVDEYNEIINQLETGVYL